MIISIGLSTPALAQLTTTPGPGGIPIAPGPVPHGYTPGGTGIGGVEVAPGPAARSVPMYRTDPGGNPVLIMPEPETGRRPGGGGGARASRGGGVDCTEVSCLPEGLKLTIAASETSDRKGDAIDTMAGLRTALRACWTPPDQPRGMEMSVRFSFRRNGELLGAPFVTYAPPGIKSDARQAWRRNIATAIEHCAPFAFSPRFAAAVAGKPLSVRFVDDRKRQ